MGCYNSKKDFEKVVPITKDNAIVIGKVIENLNDDIILKCQDGNLLISNKCLLNLPSEIQNRIDKLIDFNVTCKLIELVIKTNYIKIKPSIIESEDIIKLYSKLNINKLPWNETIPLNPMEDKLNNFKWKMLYPDDANISGGDLCHIAGNSGRYYVRFNK